MTVSQIVQSQVIIPAEYIFIRLCKWPLLQSLIGGHVPFCNKKYPSHKRYPLLYKCDPWVGLGFLAPHIDHSSAIGSGRIGSRRRTVFLGANRLALGRPKTASWERWWLLGIRMFNRRSILDCSGIRCCCFSYPLTEKGRSIYIPTSGHITWPRGSVRHLWRRDWLSSELSWILSPLRCLDPRYARIQLS